MSALEVGGVRQQQIGRVAVARQAAEARLDPEPREAPRDALAAVDDRLRQHRRIGGDDLDMLGAREQRRGVADRPRRRLAAVPRGDDAVEARRIALDAGHDDDRATALGEDRAGEVVEARRPAGLDLLDHDQIEAARESRRVHRLNGVRIVVVERLGLDPGGAAPGRRSSSSAARAFASRASRSPRIAAWRASSEPSASSDRSRRGHSAVTRASTRLAKERA